MTSLTAVKLEAPAVTVVSSSGYIAQGLAMGGAWTIVAVTLFVLF